MSTNARTAELTLQRRSTALIISCSETHATASIHALEDGAIGKQVVFSIGFLKGSNPDRFELDLQYGPCLWVRGASFNLSAEEAKRVEEALTPTGKLQITRKESAA